MSPLSTFGSSTHIIHSLPDAFRASRAATSLVSATGKVVQACSAWCLALSRRSLPTEAPLCMNEHSIFRMEWEALLDTCSGLSHRVGASTCTWQYDGTSQCHRRPPYWLCESPLTRQARACGPWPLEMSSASKYRHHRTAWCRLSKFIVPSCHFFLSQDLRTAAFSLNTLRVSNRHSASRQGSQRILLHQSRR